MAGVDTVKSDDLLVRLMDIYNDTWEGDKPTIKDAIDEIERLRDRVWQLQAEKRLQTAYISQLTTPSKDTQEGSE